MGDEAAGAAPLSRGGRLLAAPWAVPALAAAAAALAHAGALAGTWQFDDWDVVVRDPRVQSLGAWWASMPGIRPLLKLSFALNHATGLGVAGFHAVNVALHALNAALAAALVREVEARAAPAGPPSPLVPLVAALLFAVHPVQTEAVAYVSGRSASLAASFALLSALAHLRARQAPSLLLFACALATKEYAVVLPAALVVLELADPRRPASLRAALRATAPHWALVAAGAAAFAAAPAYRRMVAASLELRGPAANLGAHLHGLAWLSGQVLRPDRLDADPVLPAPAGLDATALVTLTAIAAAVALGIRLLRSRPGFAAPVLWTIAWLPVAGWLLPRPEPANDRQLYLALLGPAWLVARAVGAAAARSRVALAASLAGAAALAGALALSTAARNRAYEDEVRFWEAALRTSPANGRALNNLGFALAARCRRAEAEEALRRAVALDPGNTRAGVNLRLLRAGETLGPDEPACPP